MEVIREAQVIKNNSADKDGKIQVRIFPEMIDLPDSDLPWIGIYKIGTGTTSTIGVHEVPEVGSYIRVIIEDWPFLKRVRYISDDYVEGLYIYSQFASKVSISELGTQTYPQPFFKCYKDGTIEFHNSETGEHGVFYKGGGYFLSDASGNVFLNAKAKAVKAYNNNGKIELTSDGTIKLNGDTKQFVTWTELNTALATLAGLLTSHVHPVTAVGSPTGPAPTLVGLTVDISSAKTTKVLTN